MTYNSNTIAPYLISSACTPSIFLILKPMFGFQKAVMDEVYWQNGGLACSDSRLISVKYPLATETTRQQHVYRRSLYDPNTWRYTDNDS